MAGNLVKSHLLLYVFCTLSGRFVQVRFCLLCPHLAVHYFAVYLVLGSLISKPQQQGQQVQWVCKGVLVISSFRCHSYTKQKCEMATFCILERT